MGKNALGEEGENSKLDVSKTRPTKKMHHLHVYTPLLLLCSSKCICLHEHREKKDDNQYPSQGLLPNCNSVYYIDTTHSNYSIVTPFLSRDVVHDNYIMYSVVH